MAITVRAAIPSDYPILRAIMARAFKNGANDEALLWDYLVARDPALTPDMIRVAVHEGRPVACTMILPRKVMTPRGEVDGAIVTLVACEPALQGQGFGSAANRDALAYMAERAMAVGVLYGHPSYYPRFGYAPVLAHWDTTLKPDQLPAADDSALRSAAPGDLGALAALYRSGPGRYPCAVARDASPWLWQVRNPDLGALLTLSDLSAYALVTVNDHEQSLDVQECAAAEADAARRLLAGLGAEAKARGREKLRLFGPPDGLVQQMGLLLGGSQRYFPASPGMAVITRWPDLLPAGYAVVESEGLNYSGRMVLKAGRQALTQLALGYRTAGDLALLGQAEIADGAAAMLEKDFPRRAPHWSLDPFWYTH